MKKPRFTKKEREAFNAVWLAFCADQRETSRRLKSQLARLIEMKSEAASRPGGTPPSDVAGSA